MSQRRMVHDTIWSSEQFGTLSRDDRLLYIGLITIADDEGRFIASPLRLRGFIFPYDTDISIEQIQTSLEVLHTFGLIYLYQVDGKQYGYHPNWLKFQTLRADRVKKSLIPSHKKVIVNQMTTKEQPTAAEVSKEVSNKEVFVLKKPESLSHISNTRNRFKKE